VLKKLFSHTFIYGFANQIPKIAGVLALPFITRDLTEFDYGVYGVITAYSAAIEVFSTLGLRIVLVNSFYKHPHRYQWLWRQIYGFLILWIYIFAAIKSLVIYWTLPEGVVNPLLVVALNVGSEALFGPTGAIGNILYQVKERPVPIAIRTAIFGSLTIFLNLVFIAYFKLGYMGWFYSTFIVGVLSNLSYLIPLIRTYKITPIFKVSFRRMGGLLKVTLPTIPHYYSVFLLNTSDKVVMERLKVSTEDIGRYNVAYTVGNFFQSLGVVSGFAIAPLMNACYQRNDDKGARELVYVLQVVFFLASFFVCIWLREIFSILIKNETLALTYPLGIIIVMSYNYRPMYFGAINKLFYLERTKILWLVSFTAGALNFVSNLILIPIYGYQIAAVTTFVSLMFMGYSGYYLKDFRTNNTVRFYPMFWMLGTVLLTALAYSLRDVTILTKIMISAVIAVLTGLAMLKFTSLRKRLNTKL